MQDHHVQMKIISFLSNSHEWLNSSLISPQFSTSLQIQSNEILKKHST
jgi:hypothetical protein